MQKLNFILLLILVFSSCESDNLFAVQNCYGGSAEVIIEFKKDLSKVESDLVGQIKDDKINFKLEYTKEKHILRTSFEEIKEGLPFNKMIIIRNSDTTVLNYGDVILPMMDTDVFGKIACPYSICTE